MGFDSTYYTYGEVGSSLGSHLCASHTLTSPSGRLLRVRLSNSLGRRRSENRSGEMGLVNREADHTREAGERA